MADAESVTNILAGLALFADLSRPQLEAVAHTFDEQWFAQGQRILRQGLTGSGLFVVLDGEAAVTIDGQTRAVLSRGDFFGEISVLLGEPPAADIVALRPLRCLVLSGADVEAFLISHPRVMYRMLQAEARRLRSANLWRS
ncbi:MAG: cyclic nucleotide-binding domain-containing protein [Armatimonadetes bacterium]|nr:cyclic nucleotide-binding domain-containing protein [Armatimonadota bacterium]